MGFSGIKLKVKDAGAFKVLAVANVIVSNQYCLFKNPQPTISLTTAEITAEFLSATLGEIQKLLKGDKPIQIELSIRSIVYEFVATNFDISLGPTTSSITFYCVSDVGKFNTQVGTEFFEGKTSVDVIKDVVGKSGLKFRKGHDSMLSISTSDSMDWIRAGETQLEFLSNVVRRVYAPNDLVLVSTDNKDVCCVALSKASSQNPVVTFYFGDTSGVENKDKAIYVTRPKLSTSIGNTSFVLANNKVPMYQITKKDSILLSAEFKAGSFHDVETMILPTSVDCGNTYPKFRIASLENKRKLVRLLSTCWFLECEDMGLGPAGIGMLDIVEINFNISTSYKEKFIIVGIDRQYTTKQDNVRFTLVQAMKFDSNMVNQSNIDANTSALESEE